MRREMIKIDEELCDGCGLCVSSCAEGALQIVDGKARLVSDNYCDGLGACLADCPQGALTIPERSQIPKQYLWNPGILFASIRSWDKEKQRIRDALGGQDGP